MQALNRPCRGQSAFGTRRPGSRPGFRSVLRCRAQVEVVQATIKTSTDSLPQLPALNDDYEKKVTFANFANWLIPGALMLGRYPYVEPSRCLRRELGEEQLKAILEQGVTTFVSLQAELPPQEKMTLAGKNGFMPYKATADLIRASLNGPPPMEIVEGLRNPMLDKFLPPRKRHEGVKYDPLELQFAHCPIEDLGVPQTPQLAKLLEDLEARITRGEKLYVHCWGGRGRAGLVGACLLAAMYGLTAEESLKRVQRAFDTRNDGGRLSPETEEQHKFVEDFIRAWKQAKA